MRANVGTTDKFIRIAIGIALLAYAYLGEGQIRWIGLIGVVPVLTTLVGFCPLYAMLGLRTCPAGLRR